MNGRLRSIKSLLVQMDTLSQQICTQTKRVFSKSQNFPNSPKCHSVGNHGNVLGGLYKILGRTQCCYIVTLYVEIEEAQYRFKCGFDRIIIPWLFRKSTLSIHPTVTLEQSHKSKISCNVFVIHPFIDSIICMFYIPVLKVPEGLHYNCF